MNAIPPADAGRSPTAEVSQGLPAGNEIAKRRKKKVREGYEQPEINIVAMMDMMTIILVFLLKSVSFTYTSTSGITGLNLPYSTTNTEPVEAVKIFVTRDAVIVEDKVVARIESDLILSEYLSADDSYLIPDLKKELDKKAVYFVNLKKAFPDFEVQGNLTILADKDTPYVVLMQVLDTVSRVSEGDPGQEFTFRKFRLTVLRKDL
jgi:biopolymer transport protein ExbD